MEVEEAYLNINGLLWSLKWCQNDYFESKNILREIEYAVGSIKLGDDK